MNFRGKVVVITGASSGIGRQLSTDLALHGAKLALIARRKEKLEETQRLLGNAESNIYICDVSDADKVQKTIVKILNDFKAVDILVNNAGFNVQGEFEKVPIKEINDIMLVNYNGAVNLIKAILPSMLKNRHGRIINVSSVSGLEGVPNSAAYSASKFALIGLSESLYFELRNKGVHVSVFCPARTRTEFFTNNPSYQNTSYANGKMKMMDVKFVSRAILKSIGKKEFMTVVPLQAKYRIRLKNFLPGCYMWIKRKILEKRLYKL